MAHRDIILNQFVTYDTDSFIVKRKLCKRSYFALFLCFVVDFNPYTQHNMTTEIKNIIANLNTIHFLLLPKKLAAPLLMQLVLLLLLLLLLSLLLLLEADSPTSFKTSELFRISRLNTWVPLPKQKKRFCTIFIGKSNQKILLLCGWNLCKIPSFKMKIKCYPK